MRRMKIPWLLSLFLCSAAAFIGPIMKLTEVTVTNNKVETPSKSVPLSSSSSPSAKSKTKVQKAALLAKPVAKSLFKSSTSYVLPAPFVSVTNYASSLPLVPEIVDRRTEARRAMGLEAIPQNPWFVHDQRIEPQQSAPLEKSECEPALDGNSDQQKSWSGATDESLEFDPYYDYDEDDPSDLGTSDSSYDQ